VVEVPPDPLDDLFEEEEDFWSGLEEPKRRRRRGAGTAGGAGVLFTTPDTLTANDSMPPGTVIGTLGVAGGFGTYTYSIVDPSGRFTVVGNQIQVASPLSPAFYNVTFSATNGLGDNPSLASTIFVTHFSAYVPTYHIYGF